MSSRSLTATLCSLCAALCAAMLFTASAAAPTAVASSGQSPPVNFSAFEPDFSQLPGDYTFQDGVFKEVPSTSLGSACVQYDTAGVLRLCSHRDEQLLMTNVNVRCFFCCMPSQRLELPAVLRCSSVSRDTPRERARSPRCDAMLSRCLVLLSLDFLY